MSDGRLPTATSGVLRYATMPGSSSFTDFLAAAAPDLLPRGTPTDAVPHGTTIVAAVFDGGVVMAGDRRATAGNLIAQRDIEKVFAADDYSLDRYRGRSRTGHRDRAAVPGRTRALREDRGHPAHARRQGQPARDHDPRQPRSGDAGPGRRPAVRRLRRRCADTVATTAGRIFSFDVAGGRYPEQYYDAIGSGLAVRQGRR